MRPNKLVKNADVFTLLHTVGGDSGVYRCKAVNQAGEAISSRGTMLIIDPSKCKVLLHIFLMHCLPANMHDYVFHKAVRSFLYTG